MCANNFAPLFLMNVNFMLCCNPLALPPSLHNKQSVGTQGSTVVTRADKSHNFYRDFIYLYRVLFTYIHIVYILYIHIVWKSWGVLCIYKFLMIEKIDNFLTIFAIIISVWPFLFCLLNGSLSKIIMYRETDFDIQTSK